MWIPENVREIEDAARHGDLKETATFDAKAGLPEPKKNADLAVDISAMTGDGGELLYGIKEDDHRRPTIPNPIDLRGTRERIDQISQTSISEPPYLEIREYPMEADPSKGYLLVVIPQSPRAPHMVTVGGENRFYGRGATGNRVLTEGEVARLYQRRQTWEVDRELLLAEAIAQGPGEPPDELAYLYAFARPLPPDQSMWDRAEVGSDTETLLRRLGEAANEARPNQGVPTLHGAQWERFGADMWRLHSGEHTRFVGSECHVNIDGRGWLFCGRAGEELKSGKLAIFEAIIASHVSLFFALMGAFYEAAGYRGQVDLGLAVIGISSGVSGSLSSGGHVVGHYAPPTFTRTERVVAAELRDSAEIPSRMLRRLFDATAGTSFDPFQPPWA